jgi:hypothetical protein
MSDTVTQLVAAIVGAVVPILVAAINDWAKKQNREPAPAQPDWRERPSEDTPPL